VPSRISAWMIPVIRNPEMTKKISTPTKAAENARRLEVESDHRQDGKRAQPVDVFTVTGGHELQLVGLAGFRVRR